MPKIVEYYLSKGFESKAAEYFAAGRRKPVSVVPQNQMKLLITFDNNEQRILDMKPLIHKGTVYSILNDESIFNEAKERRRIYSKRMAVDFLKTKASESGLNSDRITEDTIDELLGLS